MKILVVIIFLIILAGTITAVHASIPIEEAGLSENTYPYEINPDSMGMLWISSFGINETDPGEVWQVDPATSTMQYTKYVIQYPQGQELVPGNPSDARRDGAYFWWADGFTNIIGRGEVADGVFLLWKVSGAETFYGTAVDNLGRLWAAEWPFDFPIPENVEPNLIQLTIQADNTSAIICSFSLPDKGGTRYMAYDHPYLWLGDEVNSRIIRLDVTNYHYDSWEILTEHTTFGLTVDAEGDLWFADWEALVEFKVDTKILTVYEIPLIGAPQMVVTDAKRVWYSGFTSYHPTVGVLDSTVALPTVQQDISQTWAEGTLTPACDAPVPPDANDVLTFVTGSSGWTNGSYDELVNNGGWFVIKLLDGGNPWGIAYLDEMVYVVDSGRQKLGKYSLPLLALEKTASPLTYDTVGDSINYTYQLTNIDIVTLTGPFTVTDDKTIVTCPPTPSLAPWGNITCTAEYIITQADLDSGSLTNTAIGHGHKESTLVDSNADSVTITAITNPVITLEKTAEPLTYDSVGEVVSYSFKLTNSGNVTLVAPFTVTDDKTSDESCPSTPTTLAPGASITCTASYSIIEADIQNELVTNTAQGHGYFGETLVDSNQDSETISYVPVELKYSVFLPLILR